MNKSDRMSVRWQRMEWLKALFSGLGVTLVEFFLKTFKPDNAKRSSTKVDIERGKVKANGGAQIAVASGSGSRAHNEKSGNPSNESPQIANAKDGAQAKNKSAST
jgi:hypothetical protein